ncbi:UNVERIFIED_CONTAM: hypothetical protein Sangu_0072100 [Sesamum angustifolium]|uniref:Myb-like domain-containing protein n=1 Tax=Sesamum angustifolium TaxID=2727405 RepID=A0AAW2RJR6_9LAMI
MGHCISNESEGGLLSTDSPLSNDGDNFGDSSNRGSALTKGPWTTAEDAILIDYVKSMVKGTGTPCRSIQDFHAVERAAGCVYSFVPQSIGLQKCPQDPDEPMSDYGVGPAAETPSFDRAHTDNCENGMSQSFGFCIPYDPDHTELPLGINQDSHFMPNGFSAASKPIAGAEKSELPSLQYQANGFGVWNPAPESLEFIQSSIGWTPPSGCPSPKSSGLLEALLYEANALSQSRDQFSDKAASSTISASDITDGSALKTSSQELKGYMDPLSSLGNSVGSIFNESPAHAIGSSLEEKLPEKSSVADHSLFRHLLSLSYCELNMSSGTSVSSLGLSSCTWNTMPAVCQKSDHP